MKGITIKAIRLTAIAALALEAVSCGNGEMPVPADSNIRFNAAVVDGDIVDVNAAGDAASLDNTFKVLFWLDAEPLEIAEHNNIFWTTPYLASHALQPVPFYSVTVYDTAYPYPQPDTAPLYATGYSPGNILQGDATEGYRVLTANVGSSLERGRYDFMGCDVWRDVYRGTLADPFAQQKNVLYFRHLSAKLKFFADRDATMEKRQYVRNVRIRDLRMSIDGGSTWTWMHTPSAFEWKVLDPAEDFTPAYTKMIETVRAKPGNETAATEASVPKAGYVTMASETFAGSGSGYVLERGNTDLVPIRGYRIDSCFVCNPYKNGVAEKDQPIRLMMDISAELSYDQTFPVAGKADGTDNITFTREWKNVEVTNITLVDETGTDIEGSSAYVFKPGNEYRIYIHFSRTGVDVVAREQIWNFDGVHFIPILGGDIPSSTEK